MRHAVLACLFALTPLLSPAVLAADQSVVVTDAIARAMPKVAPASAVFLTLRNTSDKPMMLTGGHTAAARNVELHTHSMQDGMMAMRRIPHVHLPPGSQVVFQPGDLHIMLIGLQQDLKDGEQIELTLEFGDTEPMTISVPVGNPSANAAHHQHSMH